MLSESFLGQEFPRSAALLGYSSVVRTSPGLISCSEILWPEHRRFEDDEPARVADEDGLEEPRWQETVYIHLGNPTPWHKYREVIEDLAS